MRAYAKHHQFVSAKQVIPVILDGRSSHALVAKARRRLEGKYTPKHIASNMVAWFGYRWTMNENDPKYSYLFRKLDRRPEGPPWFYKIRGRAATTSAGRVLTSLAKLGFQPDPAIRRAIEDHSMRVATKHFEGKGFKVKNTSANRPYDLLCTNKKVRLFVEVKGTQELGQGVILTANEVEHLKQHRRNYVLFVLHSIEVNGKRSEGGRWREVAGPKIAIANLKPINYSLKL